MLDDRTEELVRAALERDAAMVLPRRPEWDDALHLRRSAPSPPRRRRAAIAVVAAASAGVITFVGLSADRPDAGETTLSGPATTDPAPSTTAGFGGETTTSMEVRMSTTTMMASTTTLAPPVTLPPAADLGAPVTVSQLPPTYYRIAPDLDLGWVEDASGPQLHWRTPAGTGNVPVRPDGAAGAMRVVTLPSSPGHTVIVVVPQSNEPNRASTIRVTLVDGGTLTLQVHWDDLVEVGISRADVDAGSISTAG